MSQAPPAAPVVIPAVDYEPPPTRVDARPALAPARMRPPDTRRRTVPVARCEPAVPTAAHTFADAALRSVLEVLDRRRPVTQLRPLMPLPIVDVVTAIAASTRPTRAAAVLRRVRLRAAGADPVGSTAAEVFATYTRGNRVGAIAGRVELVPTTAGVRWQLMALHLG